MIKKGARAPKIRPKPIRKIQTVRLIWKGLRMAMKAMKVKNKTKREKGEERRAQSYGPE